MAKTNGREQETKPAAQEPVVDLYRAIVFPNRMREQRQRGGFAKLLPLAAQLPEIPYIRLSKIERGEVVARADELRRIAQAIGVEPTALLLNIDAAGFDIARWAEPFRDGADTDPEEERFAVLLAAALRSRRAHDPALTIAAIERDYGLPPVNLSRVENAQKPFARWNAATQRALFALFDVANEAALRSHVAQQHRSGALDPLLDTIDNPAARHARSRARIAELAEALAAGAEPTTPQHTPTTPPALAPRGATRPVRLVPVFGGALPQGLIAHHDSGETIEAPHLAGPNAFGLRLSRATLGAGLPAHSTVIADPDRLPAPGGLAALRDGEGWRLLSVGSDRDGRMIGYSLNPALEIPLDDCDPASLATIVAALFA